MNAHSHCDHTVAPPSAMLASSLLRPLVEPKVSEHDIVTGDVMKLCTVKPKLQLGHFLCCVQNSSLQSYKGIG